MNLTGKTAIITGAGKGIGRGLALKMAAEGANVVCCARTAADIEEAADEIKKTGGKAVAVPADVASEEDVKRLFKEAKKAFGPVDILINNAAVLELAPIAETTLDMWERLIDINLTGTFLCCREALPDMMERKTGKIVNIGSLAGRRGYPEQAAYCASKHGLIGFTKVLSLETQKYGIRVHVVAPGGVMTDLSADLRNSRGGVDESEWMTVDEVVDGVMYVLGQEGAAHTDEVVLRRFASEPWR